jgi:hypothetical protein
MSKEVLMEKEKELDGEISQEIEKVKMSEDFLSGLKNIDGDQNMDPLSLTANLNSLLQVSNSGYAG